MALKQRDEEVTRPNGVIPSMLCRPLREHCDLGNKCPAEHALAHLYDEHEARVSGDSDNATNLDRLADAYTKQALAVEQIERTIDVFDDRFKVLESNVGKVLNVRWWLAGTIAAFEVLREGGIIKLVGELLKGIGQ